LFISAVLSFQFSKMSSADASVKAAATGDEGNEVDDKVESGKADDEKVDVDKFHGDGEEVDVDKFHGDGEEVDVDKFRGDGNACVVNVEHAIASLSVSDSVRYITSAAVDRTGEIYYTYGKKKRQPTKVRGKDKGHGLFADTYVLTKAADCMTDFTVYDVANEIILIAVKYFASDMTSHLDVFNSRLICSWRDVSRYHVDIWDLDTNERLATSSQCGSYNERVTYGIYGDSIVLCRGDGRLSSLRIDTKSINFKTDSLSPRYSTCYLLQTANDSQILTITDSNDIVVLDAVDGKVLISKNTGLRGTIIGITASPDKTLYSLWSESAIAVFDAATFEQLGQAVDSGHSEQSVCFGPDNKIIFCRMNSGYVVWDYVAGSTREIIVDISGRPAEFRRVAFNLSNNMIIGEDCRSRRLYAVDFDAESAEIATKLGMSIPFPVCSLCCVLPDPCVVLM
jgi:hypothetical protein